MQPISPKLLHNTLKKFVRRHDSRPAIFAKLEKILIPRHNPGDTGADGNGQKHIIKGIAANSVYLLFDLNNIKIGD